MLYQLSYVRADAPILAPCKKWAPEASQMAMTTFGGNRPNALWGKGGRESRRNGPPQGRLGSQ